MAITAEQITKALVDKPIQPLYNTIAEIMFSAGIPVIITNTNVGLTVTAKATVGSAPAGTPITQEMISGSKSGLKTLGYDLIMEQYFTDLDLTTDITTVPMEMRNDVAGLTDEALFELLAVIGQSMSEKLLANFFLSLPNQISTLIPTANISYDMSGKIEFNPTVKTPETGKTSIAVLLKNTRDAFPATMLPGGAAGKLITVWVSAQDFLTIKDGAHEAYQPTSGQGVATTYFQYVKEASTLDEQRNRFEMEKIVFGNMIILPLNGLPKDSIFITYQESASGRGKAFYDKIPAALKNNFYMVLKGAFTRNDEFVLDVENRAKAMYDLPYQIGELFTINKQPTAMVSYNIISWMYHSVLFREPEKFFAYLPGAKPVIPGA